MKYKSIEEFLKSDAGYGCAVEWWVDEFRVFEESGYLKLTRATGEDFASLLDDLNRREAEKEAK